MHFIYCGGVSLYSWRELSLLVEGSFLTHGSPFTYNERNLTLLWRDFASLCTSSAEGNSLHMEVTFLTVEGPFFTVESIVLHYSRTSVYHRGTFCWDFLLQKTSPRSGEPGMGKTAHPRHKYWPSRLRRRRREGEWLIDWVANRWRQIILGNRRWKRRRRRQGWSRSERQRNRFKRSDGVEKEKTVKEKHEIQKKKRKRKTREEFV